MIILYDVEVRNFIFYSVSGISVNLSSFLSPNFYILHYSLISLPPPSLS